MNQESTLYRPPSFRKAINNSTIQTNIPKQHEYHEAQLVPPCLNGFNLEMLDKRLYDVPHSNNKILQDSKAEYNLRQLPRNHSSDSTSSDDSLLSSKSVISTPVSKLLCLVLLTLTLFVLTSFLYVFLKLRSLENDWKKQSKLMESYVTGFCVPCEDLTLGPFKEDNQKLQLLEKRKVDGAVICCAKSSNQTLLLANLIIDRNRQKYNTEYFLQMEQRETMNTSSTQVNTPKPLVGAHVLVGLQTAHNKADAPTALKNLEITDPVTYVEGLHVTSELITIKQSGTYFVYSQIYFSHLYSYDTKQNTSQTLNHYVYRYNVIYPNGGNELLLKSVRTQCWAKERIYTDDTSYTAGAFKLNAGDKLYVMVSDINTVSRDSKANFFGVFLLS